jgi:hypothetical protein
MAWPLGTTCMHAHLTWFHARVQVQVNGATLMCCQAQAIVLDAAQTAEFFQELVGFCEQRVGQQLPEIGVQVRAPSCFRQQPAS